MFDSDEQHKLLFDQEQVNNKKIQLSLSLFELMWHKVFHFLGLKHPPRALVVGVYMCSRTHSPIVALIVVEYISWPKN